MNTVDHLLFNIPHARMFFAHLLGDGEGHLRGVAHVTAGTGIDHELDVITLLHG